TIAELLSYNIQYSPRPLDRNYRQESGQSICCHVLSPVVLLCLISVYRRQPTSHLTPHASRPAYVAVWRPNGWLSSGACSLTPSSIPDWRGSHLSQFRNVKHRSSRSSKAG